MHTGSSLNVISVKFYMFVSGKKCLCKATSCWKDRPESGLVLLWESVTVCLRDSPMESMQVKDVC